MDRQGAVKAFSLDAGSLGNFGDALGLGEVTQCNEQGAGLVFIFQCRFEVLGGEIRLLPEPSNDGLIVRDANFAFHEVPVLNSSPVRGQPPLRQRIVENIFSSAVDAVTKSQSRSQL